MIQEFVDVFMEHKDELVERYKAYRPSGYDQLVKDLITLLRVNLPERDRYYGDIPDPTRITELDYGSYQGTKLFVIGSTTDWGGFWSIFVNYGSCSGCDTFLANQGYSDEISEDEAKGNVDMMLHMVQSMKVIEE